MTKYTEVMKIDNVWRMVIKGVINYSYTGIGNNKNGTWYLKDGTVKFDYTGTYFEGDKAYIVENGQVKATAKKEGISLVKIDTTWRAVVNGYVDYNYEGIVTNENGTWLVENGKVTFKYTGIYKDATGTYLFSGSKLRTDTTIVMKIDNVWRMIVKGIVDYNYTGIGKNENGVWYVENGTVNFGYTGTYFEGDKAYIVENGQIKATAKKEGISLVKIDTTWRVIVNGYVDYKYEGIVTNEKGTWYVKNGTVDFKYTGNYTDENGKTYIIEKSEVMTKYTKVMKIDNVWRMVVKGIVDYNYTGIGTNENGTWLVEKGAVTFNYTGTYTIGTKAYILEGSKVYATVTTSTTEVIKVNNIWRMVINGVVDYKYNGIGTNSLGMWVLQNGAVNFNFTKSGYKDSEGSIYNVVNGEVREVISKVGHPGTMWIDEPVKGVKYSLNTLNISGWALSEEKGDIIQIYLDKKYICTATRNDRPDVFQTYSKNEYGGKASTPLPGFKYVLNTSGLSRGAHTLRIVNLSSDKKTIIQSREVEFKLTNLVQSRGIDVSHYNGNIDWYVVKNSGVDFAILKIGEYHESSGAIVKDSNFDSYYNSCKSLGIAVGGYFYSYAFNSDEASREASACLQIIGGRAFEMPIFLDVEDNILKNAVASGRTNKNELTNASITFCDIMNRAGHKAGVYASRNFFYEYLNVSQLERYNIWLAHYTTSTDYVGKYDLWQYTNTGSVPGINGNVDLDWCFTRYY